MLDAGGAVAVQHVLHMPSHHVLHARYGRCASAAAAAGQRTGTCRCDLPAAPLPHPTGGDGGAVAIVSSGTIKFINCQFYGNTADWSNGGAVSTSATTWYVLVQHEEVAKPIATVDASSNVLHVPEGLCWSGV